MIRTLPKLSVLFLASVAVFIVIFAWRTAESSALDKVDAWVLDTAASQPTTEFLLYLSAQADVSQATSKSNKVAKGTYVYDQLRNVALQSQAPIVAILESAGVDYRQFWVVNMIWVKGDMNLVRTLAQRDDVAYIYGNPTIAFDAPTADTTLSSPAGIEWNITKVNAPDVWALGNMGQKGVIGGQDTGYEWTHPAIQNTYRGWDGQTADHDYNWHDSIHSGGGSCGADATAPCDDHNHGTHTMGTMVGDDGGANQIGIAPDAQWIGCRNMNVGNGTPATYTECYEWFIAPYPIGGDPLVDGDPTKAPHAINNSWSCPGSEGCSWDTLQQVTENVRAAGILTSHSAGNSGPSCSTVNTPSAIYDASFSVGATNSGDAIASFSSRGPVTVDGSNRMKPDISAPGQSVRSAIRGGGYSSFSGTSMASPHVAGLVALIVTASPDLAGQVDMLESIIQESALPQTTSQGCGGDGNSDVPNNVFGYGRIDALAAYNMVRHHLTVSSTAALDHIAPGELLTYTLAVSHTHITTQTNNVVLTSTIPNGTIFVSSPQSHAVTGDTIMWTAPAIDQHGTWEVELIVQADVSTTGKVMFDDYHVSSDEVFLPVAGTLIQTPVIAHALGIRMQSDTAVASGSPLTYTITVTNLHPLSPAHDVVLSNMLPAHTTFVTATGNYMQIGDTIEWQAAELAANATWTVHLVVAVSEATMTIVNDTYGVYSSEVPTTVSGPAITTMVIAQQTYIPMFIND